jgi:peptidoglycan/xylan/chitin deacetylase (PgdA/CDA1 family)
VHPTNAFASATPDQFDQQMRWRKEHCDVIPLREALDRAAGDRDPRSKPAVAITFDDGYDDNFVHAYPILQRHGIEASFFVTTGCIGGDIRSRIRTSPSSGPKRSGPSSATPSAPSRLIAVRRSTPSCILSASADGTSSQTIALARDSGYKIGASILYRDVRWHDDALNIPRISVKNNTIRLLRAKIVGSLDILGRWQEYRARGAFPVQDDGGTEDR